MTPLEIRLEVLKGRAKAEPDNKELSALSNNTANSALVDEQIEMLESCPKHEAMSEIENVNGLAAHKLLK